MNRTAPPRLADLSRCFLGVIPSIVSTADADGIPNVTYVSQVFYVDEHHVALSCQFFNKTRKNLDANPLACAQVVDPLTFQAYRLRLRFLRSESIGPLFDSMAVRIEAIASQTGMAGIFRLLSADVFEVISANIVEGFLAEPPLDDPSDRALAAGRRTELRGLRCVSEQINRAEDLESLLSSVLEALDGYFGFEHTMVLIAEPSCDRLVTVASRGYGESGVGAEVQIGEGLIGTAAKQRRILRIAGLDSSLRYGRAMRREVISRESHPVAPEIPLPGLPDAQSTLIIPLTVGVELIGVLVAESRGLAGFDEWHEGYLEVAANQIALGIDRMSEPEAEDEDEPPPRPEVASPSEPSRRRRTMTYYRADDCVFIDNDYLIRNVPGRIFWKLLTSWSREGRTEFSNRELRLDESLGLPEFKDNLESRLILLRKRLEEKCPEVRIERTGRGRFALVVDAVLELAEK
ncbi:MAG: GAF domain-containing protein [Thermoanaerobaculia bacterium]|nr:GAF domain-containing protein [Thermoanaerobaculia bacterium]